MRCKHSPEGAQLVSFMVVEVAYHRYYIFHTGRDYSYPRKAGFGIGKQWESKQQLRWII